MKRFICLLNVFLILLCGCTQNNGTRNNTVFTKSENGNIVTPFETEYSFLTNESIVSYLGELKFEGGIMGEKKVLNHLGSSLFTL